MAEPHDRSARVLDPAYLADLESHSVEELRTMHAECLELETEVSYVRRLTQARIDILEAEIERRASGQSLEELIEALPRSSPTPGRGGTRRRAASRCRWLPSRRASGHPISSGSTACSPT